MIEDSLKIIYWIIPGRTLFTIHTVCIPASFKSRKLYAKANKTKKKFNNFPQLWVVMTL